MKLTIIGASGHGKVVADIAAQNGYTEIVFLDDDESKSWCGKYPVVGSPEKISEIENDIFVAIGNPKVRESFLKEIKKAPILIHPNAVVASDVNIGKGTAIMAGAVVNPNTIIGEGCIINTCSSVDHDCKVSDYVHIAVGAHVCGTASIGKYTWIGAGATVINNIDICNESIVGAGAVVVRNIENKGTYIGVPAEFAK